MNSEITIDCSGIVKPSRHAFYKYSAVRGVLQNSPRKLQTWYHPPALARPLCLLSPMHARLGTNILSYAADVSFYAPLLWECRWQQRKNSSKGGK